MTTEKLIIANDPSGRIADLKKHRESIMSCATPIAQLDGVKQEPFHGRILRITNVELLSEFLPQDINHYMTEYLENVDSEIQRLETLFAEL